MKQSNMKILTIDIETSPHFSAHWRRWQENIPPEFTLEESHMICFAAKWVGNKNVIFSSEWEDGMRGMCKKLWELLDEADVVVGFNSNKFDVKKINTEFLRLGMKPPSPYNKVDLLLQVKKHFNFSSNRLKHLLKELGLSPKLEDNGNMKLWIDVCYFEKAVARKRMERYNKQDVLSTEEFYNYILGWITPHPNHALFIGDVDDDHPVCPNCGGTHLVKKGLEHTKVRSYQRFKCRGCGKHSRGRKAIAQATLGVLA